LGVLAAVAVGTIHQEPWLEPGLGNCALGKGNTHRIVIRLAASTQHHVRMRVALGAYHCASAFLCYAQKGMGVAHGDQGMDGAVQVSIGAILDPNRHGQAAGQFAVCLRLRGSGANGSPADEIGQVLGNDGVERFGAHGKPCLGQAQQELTGPLQACGNLERIIEMGIVDQPFPSNRGAWLFKIGSHDNEEAIGRFIGQGLESLGIIPCCLDIMDRTWSHDHQQSRVFSTQDASDRSPAHGYGFAGAG